MFFCFCFCFVFVFVCLILFLVLFLGFFGVCVFGQQKPEFPNWSSMVDSPTTWGGIGVLRSPFYICGL